MDWKSFRSDAIIALVAIAVIALFAIIFASTR